MNKNIVLLATLLILGGCGSISGASFSSSGKTSSATATSHTVYSRGDAFEAAQTILQVSRQHSQLVRAGKIGEAHEVLMKSMSENMKATETLLDLYGDQETHRLVDTITEKLVNPVPLTREHTKITSKTTKRFGEIALNIPVFQHGPHSLSAISDMSVSKTKIKEISGNSTRTLKNSVGLDLDYVGAKYSFRF